MRRRLLTATIEPFDSCWEAPDGIEKGYRGFYLFQKDNYDKLFPAGREANILCVSCGPGCGVNLLNNLGYAKVLGVDPFPDKIEYALKRKLNHLTKHEILDFLELYKRKLKPAGRLICFALNGANPFNYVAMVAAVLLKFSVRAPYIFYGENNKLFSKKIAATCIRPAA